MFYDEEEGKRQQEKEKWKRVSAEGGRLSS